MRIYGLSYLDKKCFGLSSRPLTCQMELTYACDYNCQHCYCKGSESPGHELTTVEVKHILDQLLSCGCVWLTLTGGDPLVRKDFKEIYLYARQKGFLITILTNGFRLTDRMLSFFCKYPPVSLDITINSLKPRVYQKITGFKKANALNNVLRQVKAAAKAGLSVIIKVNCLKANKNELASIKRWAYALPKNFKNNLANFHYDTIIYPRLNGDTSPCQLRLTPQEICGLAKQDKDITQEHRLYLEAVQRDYKTLMGKKRDNPLYYCNTYKDQCVIDPFGCLKPCGHNKKYSVDLRKVSLKRGFYKVLPDLAKERFTTTSPCRVCALRPMCFSCPAKAYLEAGDEEKPVEYFCQLAHYLFKKSSSEAIK